jgi:AbrB family looped-hinge helix DNA binding protein
MNAKTKLSAKGQVVIPKDVREHLNLKPGQTLDVIETAGGVLLRPAARKSGRTTEEVLSSLRQLASEYKGPPIPIEKIDAAAEEAWGYRAGRNKK